MADKSQILAVTGPPAMDLAAGDDKVRLAQAAMGQRETHVTDLCRELGVSFE
jgi:hypothetical protein